MHERRTAHFGTTRQRRGEALKDEVYRQMFRLEAHRPGAELELTVALLRAWMIAGPGRTGELEHSWLKKVCPICLTMIEVTRQSEEL
jgi:hypothetical protein